MADKLRVGDVGADVARLHKKLGDLGLKIPPSELKRKFFGPGTRDAVLNYQQRLGLPSSGEVDEVTSTALSRRAQVPAPLPTASDGPSSPAPLPRKSTAEKNLLSVRGTVTTTNNKPLVGATVFAFDRDLRKEQPLGNARTNKSGQYVITYSADKFLLGDVPSANVPKLIVRAYDSRGQQIGKDIVPANPSRDQVVNFKAGTPPVSEWEALSAAVKPLLAGQGKGDQNLPEEELTSADLDFIAGETGLDRERLRLWALGFALGRSADGGGVAPAIFYGWFHLGLPTTPSSLWSTPTDKLVATLTAAIQQMIVPASVAKNPPALAGLFDQIKADRVLQAPTLNTPAPLTDLLATLPAKVELSKDQQRVLAGGLASLHLNDPQLVNRIESLPGFTGDAASVARTLRLGALTSGHLPLIAALQSRLADANEDNGTLKPLATVQPEEWVDLAYTYGPPAGATVSPAAYADTLGAAVEKQYPHAALVAHFANGRRLSLHPALTEVSTFLNANQDFDIVAANINAVKSQSSLEGVKEPDQLVAGLRSLQRMNAVGTTWDETAALLENDIYSPAQILASGPSGLSEILGGRIVPDRLQALYSQVLNLHDVAIGVFTAGFAPLSGPQILPGHALPAVTSGGDSGTLAGKLTQSLASRKPTIALAGFKVPNAVSASTYEGGPLTHGNPNNSGTILDNQPTLQALFGSQDTCACADCTSVLSPAAYYVDLLQFMSPAMRIALLGTEDTPGRRPDLQDIELSCNNTNTEVPSIDLALEILENAVALPLDVPLGPGTSIAQELPAPANPGDPVKVGADIKKALKRTVRSLPDVVYGTREETNRGVDWIIVDGRRRWKLTAREVPAFAVSLSGGRKLTFDTPAASAAAIADAFDQKSVAEAGETMLTQIFAPNQTSPPDLTNYQYAIEPLQSGQRWAMTYGLAAQLTIDESTGRHVLSSPGGGVWAQASYDQKTIAAAKKDLAGNSVPVLTQKILAKRFPDTSNLVVKPAASGAANQWSITSHDFTVTLKLLNTHVTIDSLTYQSGDPDADAIAEPENHNPEAYSRLNGPNALFPWTLPVDLPVEEVRLFLGRARCPRRRLMELLSPGDDALNQSSGFAVEVLGLNTAEMNLILQERSAQAVYDCWGLPAGTTSIFDASLGVSVSRSGPLQLLQNVSILLQQSRLSFVQLQAMLATQFIPGVDGPLTIQPANSCQPDRMTIAALKDGHLDRLHRFTRLWRKLGWTVREVDLAIQAAGGSLTPKVPATPDALLFLASVHRLKHQLNLPVPVLVGGLSKIEIEPWTDYLPGGPSTHVSLYTTIFQPEPLRSANDFADFSPPETGTGSDTVSEHSAFIGACLGVKSTIVESWVSDALGLGIEDKLNLENLSRLTGAAGLCRSLTMAQEELVLYPKLFGNSVSPFEPGMTSIARAYAMLALVKRFQLVSQSGADVQALYYLLCLPHEATGGAQDDISETQLTALAGAALAAIQSIPDSPNTNQSTPLTDREMVTVRIARENAVISALATGLNAPRELVDEFLRTRLQNPSSDALLRAPDDFSDLPGLITKLTTHQDPVSAYLWGRFSPADEDALSTASQQQTTLASALNRILQGPSIYSADLFTNAKVQLSPQTEDLRASNPTGADLVRLNRLLLQEAYPAQITARTLPPDMSFFTGGLTAKLRKFLVCLFKSLQISNAFRLTRSNLSLLRRSATDPYGLAVLDFNTLPSETGDAPANVVGFEQLLAFLQLRRLASNAGDLLSQYAAVDFSASTAKTNAQNVLAGGLVVDIGEVSDASGQLKIVAAEQYRDPIALAQLIDLLSSLKQLGATVGQAGSRAAADASGTYGLTAPSPSDADAGVARQLLRAKYGDSQWQDLVKPLSDKLRGRQRDALVDYLVYRDQKLDANDLYEQYLIDVQTGSCMVTTRLLQVTGAAQLFIQRALLNLEDGLSLSDEQREQWEWMSQYRVWEANREVFLFPENWLLPELRDDKTSIFDEMEGALTQQELTADSARDAVLEYLEEFADLAKINVIAMYRTDTTLYVVGRMPNQSSGYFWRSCEKFGAPEMFWSGWEALDVDGANDFIMPFVMEGDLHLAWPVISKRVNHGETGSNDDVQVNDLLWDVQIAWTRRTNRGWTKRKLGDKATLTVQRIPTKDQAGSFVFRLRKAASQIFLDGNPVVVGGKPVMQEETDIYCYVGAEVDALPSLGYKSNPDQPALLPLKPDYTDILNPPPSHSDSASSGQWNVSLRVHGAIYRYTTFSEDSVVYTRPFDQPVMITITYNLKNPSQIGDGHIDTVSIFMFADKDRATFDSDTSQMFGIIYPLKTNPNGPNAGHANGGEGVLNGVGNYGADVKVSFSIAGIQVPDLGPGELIAKSADGQTNQYYQDWDWTIVISIRDDSLQGVFTGQSVRYAAAAQNFVLVSEGDISLVNSGGVYTPPLLPGLAAGRINATLDPSADTALTTWHQTASTGSFYAQGDILPIYWPDGQPFASAYRTLAVVSTTDLFQPSVEEHLHTDPLANTFDRQNVYANYNWELFLHVPLRIAAYFAGQQLFESARDWLHAVFDPTTTDKADNVPQFWRFPVFPNGSDTVSTIATLLTWLANPSQANDQEKVTNFAHQIDTWKQDPFMPHVIARMRPSAYQWQTFFAYLDMLIGWGDQFFRRDTRESVNDAILLYVVAAKLLGPRPRVIPPATPPYQLTYRLLAGATDQSSDAWDFSDPWVNYADLPGVKQVVDLQSGTTSSSTATKVVTSLSTLAFCVPQNDKITSYYDTLENRLFNVRNCRNIDGVFRQLPLYDPPIDPLLLIRAKAAGLDIDSVVGQLYAPLPRYRFGFTFQKALELAAELKSLGGAMLSVLEKQDTEALGLLRADQEVSLLKLVRVTRQKQIDEADANIQALQRSQDTVLARFTQFQKLLGQTTISKDDRGMPIMEQSSSLAVAPSASGDSSGLGLIRNEIDQFSWAAYSNTYTQIANAVHLLAGIIALIPNEWTGNAMVAGATFGGSFLSGAANEIANAIQMLAVDANYHATQSGMLGGYARRQDEWIYQSKLALAEYAQLNQQIIAAQIRKDITTSELASHDAQIENAQDVDDFLRTKFTSQQLYSWMSSQLASVYFGAYQLALDQAQRAERACQYELGLYGQSPQFIQTDNWDNLKRGLLAGEHLHQDLQRLHAAYLEQNVREFEITKDVSLLQLNPRALIQLRTQGNCAFDVPEVLFDLDFPGHYMRRIKMVSLSIPCVSGPFSSISTTLQLTKAWIRISDDPGSKYNPDDPASDLRFTSTTGPITIVTSKAQQDSGMFEPNMRDERYLPFEGAGAISSWSLALPKDFPAFDYSTISDVVLHVRYTSRYSGNLDSASLEALKKGFVLVTQASGSDAGLFRLFSLRHEFPTEWARLVGAASTGSVSQPFAITKNRFPYLFSSSSISLKIVGGEVYSVPRYDATSTAFPEVQISAPKAAAPVATTNATAIGLNGVKFPADGDATVNVAVNWTDDDNAKWTLQVTDIDAFRKNVRDIFIVFRYQITAPS